jgi:hypothetical protein
MDYEEDNNKYSYTARGIKAPEAIVPSRAVCQLKKWKDGRKFGAELIFNKKQARFMTRKVI